jgi:hypothetical protein
MNYNIIKMYHIYDKIILDYIYKISMIRLYIYIYIEREREREREM